MQTRPVEQAKNRPQIEILAFDEKNIVLQDFQNNYIEYCFEEVRLKDYRSKSFDQQLINLEQTEFVKSNPLSKDKLASRVVNSPTINTRLAFEQLNPYLKGTPSIHNSIIVMESVGSDGKAQEPTVNFDALRLSLVDVERRNSERGIVPDS